MSAKARNIKTKSYNPIKDFKKLVPHHTITPYDISNILNATACHEKGITGKGITVGIVDSGCYYHPYFKDKRIGFKKMGYRDNYGISLDGWRNPTIIHELPDIKKYESAIKTSQAIKDGKIDPSKNSHGTAMVANIYATAPSINLKVYSTKEGISLYHQIEKAIEECDIISFSSHSITSGWTDEVKDKYKELFLKKNKIIIYCIGNGGKIPVPVQNSRENMVIVGGIYKHEDDSLQVSNYASAKKDFLPDVCGLCGMLGTKEVTTGRFPNKNYPNAAYIWLPADPRYNPLVLSIKGNLVESASGKVIYKKSEYDYNADTNTYTSIKDPKNFEGLKSKVFPYGTKKGPVIYPSSWNLASGTSSATPQIAGVVALILQSRRELGYRDLTIQEIRAILRGTATEVTKGESYLDEETLEGGTKATEGNKRWSLLVNAEAAVEMAKSISMEFTEGIPKLPNFEDWTSVSMPNSKSQK